VGQPYHHQEARADGCALVIVDRLGRVERHDCASAQEAEQRASAVRECLSWIGTPFQDCGFVKGPEGAIDCAMMLVGTYRAAGMIGDFDPRPYPPRWFQHSSQERFLGCLEQLGAREIEGAQILPGDVLVWQFGRTFAHGSVLVNTREVCHAYSASGGVVVTPRDEPLLSTLTWKGVDYPRPVRAFTLWGR
jgi:cell wall-associated NlpC family hydrolase